VYRFILSIRSITGDSLAFHPQVIEPPPMPIQSLESSAPITIIDESEESMSAPDTIVQTEMMPDAELPVSETSPPIEDAEQLADSLLPSEVFDSLMPVTDDIARLADSLETLGDSPSVEPPAEPVSESPSENNVEQGSGAPITALKVHRVRKGETLKIIARKKLGSEDRWKEIYNLNRDILKSPNKLKIDQHLIVLEDEEEKEAVTHTVKTGESLKSLAQMYYGDGDRWESLYKLNKGSISNPNVIFPGQNLTIITVQQRYRFPIQTHMIKSGESLKQLAKKYLGDEERWEEIQKMNKKTIKNPNKIFVGQKIKVRNETGAKNR